MANLSGQPELNDASLETAEARMRRALGDLETQASARGGQDANRPRPDARGGERHSGDRPRARFVQDGDVPVTVLNRTRPHEAEGTNGSSNRLSVAEAALASERTSRLRAERALAEAQTTLHDLQTKLGHAELARQELSGRIEAEKAAFEIERSAHQARELALTEELAAERAARRVAETAPKPARRPAAAFRAPETDDAGDPATAPVDAMETPPKRKRQVGRPRSAGAKKGEPKPVKWWLSAPKKK